MTDVIIQNLVTFRLGELPNDCIALLLGYATSQEKLSRGEIDSFVIGLTRANAAELGHALLERSGMDPAPREPKQTQH